MATVATAPRVTFADHANRRITSPFLLLDERSPHSASSSSTNSSLSAINSQLLTHGWGKRPLNLDALSDRDHNEVVGVLFELLGASAANLLHLDDMSARHRTLTYEHERLTRTHSHALLARARLEAEVSGWKAKCLDVEKRLVAEEGKTKELREELGRGRKAMDGVRIAAGHESKKIQMKLDKAQAQLGKLANDSSLLSQPQGLVLLNPIIGGRTHPVAPGQSPLLEQSLKDLAEIRASLQEETEAFRHVVVSTGNGLREALALAAGEEPPNRLLHSQFFANPSTATRSLSQSYTYTHQSASSTSHPSIADTRLRALVAEVRQKFADRSPPKSSIGDGVTTLQIEDEEKRKKVEREQDKCRRELEERVKDLEVEVTCAKAREDEAKRLVEEFARVQAQAGSSRADEADDADEVDFYEVAKEKQLLDDERRNYTEAAVRLGQERRQLEIERQAFLDEQRKADVEAMLALLPPTPPGGGGIEDLDLGVASPLASTPSWGAHRPLSPSPLSPSHSKNRTLKAHAAGRRRSVKTPLSRLVLEKAVRQKGRETATALEQERLGVLGDGSRRANTAKRDELKSSTKTAAFLKPGARSLASSSGPGAKRDLRGLARASKVWR